MDGLAAAASPDELRLYLLGGFRVVVGGREVGPGAWRLRKAQSLIKLLALTPSHRLHREQIMDKLWPDLSPDSAGNNLHQALYSARRALDSSQAPHAGSQFLRLEAGVLALRPPDHFWVDVEAFVAAADRCRGTHDPELLRIAVDRYLGDLLPEDRYEEWVSDRGRELRVTYLRLLETYAHALEEREHYDDAIHVLEKLVASEAVNEEAHLGLVRLYSHTGQRSLALSQYDHMRDTLRRDLGTEPSASSQRLYQTILAGESIYAARGAPGHNSAAPWERRTHNLPRPLNSFVGRQREMAELRRLLEVARLVTLTEAGGCGKTRLVVEAAFKLLQDYPDGVWFVELDALHEPDLVPQAVAKALGVREIPGHSTIRLLCARVAESKILLVLDNCEHLIAASARLVETLLRGSASLRIVATSREPLRVSGEVMLPVPPLTFSSPSEQSGEPAKESEAVALFFARLQNRQPDTPPATQAAAADICRRLDGIPLAIELAAALAPMMSIRHIAERLDDALSLLAHGSRTVPRHETLRMTLEWSYALLEERQRALFRRLAVFAGSFDLLGAESVGVGGDLQRADVPPLLAALVEKSMVVARIDGGETRYRLLETMRQFARESMEADGEGAILQHRHAQYYLGLAEQAEPLVMSAKRKPWLDRLDAEYDNTRAALDWALNRAPQDGVEVGLRLAGALLWYWNFQGRLGEGLRTLETALLRCSGAPAAVRAKLLYGAGEAAWAFGEYGVARARLEESIAIWRVLGNKRALAFALQSLSGTLDPRTDQPGASAAACESIQIFRELGDSWGVAVAVHSLGIVSLLQNDWTRARERLEDALSRYQELGDTWFQAQVLNGLGDLARNQGEPARAGEFYAESLALFRSQGVDNFTPSLLHNLAHVALNQGDVRQAARFFQESLALFLRQADQRGVAECLAGMAGVEGSVHRPRQAAWLLGAVETVLIDAGAEIWPSNRADYERNVAKARSQLDEQLFAEMWAEGRASSFDQAIARAQEAAHWANAIQGEPSP